MRVDAAFFLSLRHLRVVNRWNTAKETNDKNAR